MFGIHFRSKSTEAADGNDARRPSGRLARARNEEGQSIIEFALVLPMLMTIAMGIFVFGLAFSNYQMLTNGANMGAQALAFSRGQTLDPCKTVASAFYSAAPTLSQKTLTFTITVTPPPSGVTNPLGGTTSSSTSTTTGAAALPAGSQASVTVTYPCNLILFGHNFAPTCNLSAQTAEVIQ